MKEKRNIEPKSYFKNNKEKETFTAGYYIKVDKDNYEFVKVGPFDKYRKDSQGNYILNSQGKKQVTEECKNYYNLVGESIKKENEVKENLPFTDIGHPANLIAEHIPNVRNKIVDKVSDTIEKGKEKAEKTVVEYKDGKYKPTYKKAKHNLMPNAKKMFRHWKLIALLAIGITVKNKACAVYNDVVPQKQEVIQEIGNPIEKAKENAAKESERIADDALNGVPGYNADLQDKILSDEEMQDEIDMQNQFDGDAGSVDKQSTGDLISNYDNGGVTNGTVADFSYASASLIEDLKDRNIYDESKLDQYNAFTYVANYDSFVNAGTEVAEAAGNQSKEELLKNAKSFADEVVEYNKNNQNNINVCDVMIDGQERAVIEALDDMEYMAEQSVNDKQYDFVNSYVKENYLSPLGDENSSFKSSDGKPIALNSSNSVGLAYVCQNVTIPTLYNATKEHLNNDNKVDMNYIMTTEDINKTINDSYLYGNNKSR